MFTNKIRTQRALAAALRALRHKKKRIVFTNGCFDVLHRGHVTYLAKAKELGDALVVGLNSDSSVRTLKGPARPLNREDDRAIVLAALQSVDLVTIFGEETPEMLIRNVRPDVLVKGGDWRIKDIVGSDFVRSYGGAVKSIPFVDGYSTTALITRIDKAPKLKSHERIVLRPSTNEACSINPPIPRFKIRGSLKINPGRQLSHRSEGRGLSPREVRRRNDKRS